MPRLQPLAPATLSFLHRRLPRLLHAAVRFAGAMPQWCVALTARFLGYSCAPQRAVRFVVDEWLHLPAALPLKEVGDVVFSPFNPPATTGQPAA